ncbi:unnamed protein product, partial [Mesorhabditis belari]|uniref:Uncharacterized protein n=1 Tax=Mesorhabditis belari TaxID=2138241 RepID=A0AAF3ETC4_9BILA
MVFNVAFGAAIEAWLIYSDYLGGWQVFAVIHLTYFCTIMFFIGLYVACKKKFVIVYQKKYSTVEDRYRTQENYKSSRLLLYLAPYKCMTSIGCMLWYEFAVDRNTYIQTFSTFIFFYLLQYQTLIQMLLTILAERKLRNQLLNILRRRKEVTPENTVRNAMGARMIFTGAESNEIYFDQFKTMWKTQGKPR